MRAGRHAQRRRVAENLLAVCDARLCRCLHSFCAPCFPPPRPVSSRQQCARGKIVNHTLFTYHVVAYTGRLVIKAAARSRPSARSVLRSAQYDYYRWRYAAEQVYTGECEIYPVLIVKLHFCCSQSSPTAGCLAPAPLARQLFELLSYNQRRRRRCSSVRIAIADHIPLRS